MRSSLSDTCPEIEEIRVQLMRKAPPWRRLDLVGQLRGTVLTLALIGLRHRYPVSTEVQLRRRLAGLILGSELAERAYGPLEIDDAD